MSATRCLEVSFAVALFGCVGASQQELASEANAPAPVNVGQATATAAPASRPGSSPVVQGDDPKSCLDQAEAAESAWIASAVEKLDEKLPSLQRCSSGRLKREERFDMLAFFSASGAWVHAPAAKTTLPDCRVFECVAKVLATTKVDAWPYGAVPPVRYNFVLRPDLPPRHVEPTDPDVPSAEATSCGRAVKPSEVSGRLHPDVIQKVVRANYGAFRTCYEEGLGRNRHLSGRVSIRFVIERDGRVGKVSLVDTTLPDCKVARCVRDGFPKLQFPPPEGGIVTVVYPIMLEPG